MRQESCCAEQLEREADRWLLNLQALHSGLAFHS